MIFRVGKLWVVSAHKRWRYYKRRPSSRTVASIMRRYAALAQTIPYRG